MSVLHLPRIYFLYLKMYCDLGYRFCDIWHISMQGNTVQCNTFAHHNYHHVIIICHISMCDKHWWEVVEDFRTLQQKRPTRQSVPISKRVSINQKAFARSPFAPNWTYARPRFSLILAREVLFWTCCVCVCFCFCCYTYYFFYHLCHHLNDSPFGELR